MHSRLGGEDLYGSAPELIWGLRKRFVGTKVNYMPYFRRNLSTRPALSTIFCLPV